MGLFVTVISVALVLLAVRIGVRMIFLDGSRGMGPPGTQVVTLSGWVNRGFAIPLGYLITSGSEQVHYAPLLNDLHSLGLNPDLASVDGELAEHQAIRTQWPNCRVRQCYWHVAKCWREKWQKLFGFRHNSRQQWQQARLLLKRMAFAETRQQFAQAASALQQYLVSQQRGRFYTYLQKNYLLPGCRFPPQQWSLVDEKDPLARVHRTNNIVEGHNNRLKAR